MCKLISRNTGILYKLKHDFPKQILLSLYTTLILPYLNYGILAWGNGTKTQQEKILTIQKRAIRNINHVGFLFHTRPLFLKNKLLRIDDIYVYNLGIFMHQLSVGEIPVEIAELFDKNSTIHSYPTRQSTLFHLPRTRTLFAQKTVIYTGPKLWIDLPKVIIESTSLYTFKRKLKCHLLKKYLTQAENDAWAYVFMVCKQYYLCHYYYWITWISLPLRADT